MGTDIHGVFQRQNNDTGVWEDIQHELSMGRHYQLFAVLAGVRNGTGFAGVPTGDRVTPIAEPRGYPDDFANCDDMHPIDTLDVIDKARRKWREDGDPMSIWMGDHSHSWLTAEEMLGWYATAPTVTKIGILGRAQYEAWDKQSSPSSYSGGVCGGVVIINDSKVERDQVPQWSHIRVEWMRDLKEELAYFFDEVQRLKDKHGVVRFVFGFDS